MMSEKLKRCFDGIETVKETKGMTLLERSRATTSDEYYTTRETVEQVIDMLKNELEGRKIYCPFDTEESEFVKVLKKRGYNVIHTSNNFFDNIDYIKELKKQDYVILSNPPFSIETKILKVLKVIGIDFYLMGNLLKLRDFYRGGFYTACLGNLTFKNGKHVPCCLVSNRNIRGLKLERDRKKYKDDINGIIRYRKMDNWRREGRPVNCYVPITFLCEEEANYYNFDIVELPGYFASIYIREAIV